jgi:hypothetical protein
VKGHIPVVKTGPQKYPGASLTHWYQDTYGGDAMDVNVVVLHTTEGRTVPDYGGGADAPNLTALPDIANRRLLWFQHFDIDTSSRALVNLAGGVETNTLNVCQVELVGTCDPATHAAWGTAHHVYWPQAPEWALAEVARFLAWMHAQHGVPLSGPSKWPAYPASYGTNNGARMSNAAWDAFHGVCGHLHVPENLHGDPGAIDFAHLIALAQGTAEEDPMAAFTPQQIHDAVWRIDDITAPPDAPDIKTNPTWQPQSMLRDIDTRVRALQATEAAQSATIATLVTTVATLATNTAAIDPAKLVADIQQAIDNVTIHLDTTP